jgi:hypothetical protein
MASLGKSSAGLGPWACRLENGCNPGDLHSNSPNKLPTAIICRLESMELFGCDLSEDALENLAKASDFQAEYEGSIPFTRSIPQQLSQAILATY